MFPSWKIVARTEPFRLLLLAFLLFIVYPLLLIAEWEWKALKIMYRWVER